MKLINFKNIKLILILFIVGVIIFFLETCPPLDRLSFNWWLLGLCVFGVFYGYLAKDYTIVGLFIPILSGFSKLSPHHYPVVSLVSLFVLVGFILSLKFDKKILENYSQNKHIIILVLSFFAINFISFLFSYIKLVYPGTVYPVNVRGELSFHMIFHLVGYFFLPLVTGILLFFVNLIFKDEKNIKKFFIFLFIGFFLSCIAGILQALGILKGNFGYVVAWEKRVNGLFSNFNSFALALSLMIPIFMYYLTTLKKIFYISIGFLVLILYVVNLLLTGTRSAALSVILSLVIIFFVFVKFKKPISVVKFIIFVVVITFFTIGFLKISKSKIEYFGLERIITNRLKEDINTRITFWKVGFKLFKKSPIVGNGVKSFYINFYNLAPLGYLSDNACNTYVHFLAEIGIIGAVLFFFIVFMIVKFLIYSVRSEKNLEVVINISLISFLIVSFWGHHLDAEEVLILFWFLLSIVCIKDTFNRIIIKFFLPGLVSIFLVISFILNVNQLKNFNILRYKNIAGVYNKERIDGKDAHWTDKYALFDVKNFKHDKIIFEFKSPKIKQQEVYIFLDNQEYEKISLEEDNWYKLEIPIKLYNTSVIKVIPKITFYEAGILRFIFPFIGKDYRRLGVLVRFYGTD